MNDIEPLEARTWFGAIRALERRWGQHSNGDQERLLRHAYHLVQLTPRPLRQTIRADLAEAEFERLLQCRAFESAAIGLIGFPMTLSASRLGMAVWEARARMPDQSDANAARADSFASAVVGAWTHCLVALEERSIRQRVETDRPDPRRVPSAQHLRLIEP